MQTTQCVERVHTAERKSHVLEYCFSNDTTGERTHKKHSGSTATAMLKRQTEGGGGWRGWRG